jgi:hypothetical protein
MRATKGFSFCGLSDFSELYLIEVPELPQPAPGLLSKLICIYLLFKKKTGTVPKPQESGYLQIIFRLTIINL